MTESTQTTIRDTFVQQAALADIGFEAWCDQLRALGQRDSFRYGPDPIEACGADSWRDFYDNGYTPDGAWAEDGSYD